MHMSERLKWLAAAAASCVLAWVAYTTASAAGSKAEIARTIKSDVAELIAGLNAHDPDRATRFDAPDMVSMESGRPPSVGKDADRQGMTQAFQYAPSWHVGLVEETVDVSDSGDMAVYRSTYNQDFVNDGTPMTEKVNFLAGFLRQADGSWKIGWQVVCAQERPHKKGAEMKQGGLK
jgi:ketosteroid isomerase-like protein